MKTPLYYAIQTDQSDAAALLIRSGADVNHASDFLGIEEGELLWLAVTYRKIKVVTLLLERGANVNSLYKGMSILLTAALSGNAEMVETFLRFKPCLKNLPDPGRHRDIVSQMVIRGYETTLRVLLEHGANCSRKDKHSLTPLHYTAIRLTDKGTKMNESGTLGNAVAALLLVNAGALTLECDKNGCTPLHLAAQVGAANVALVLLNHTAVRDCDTPSTPLTPGTLKMRDPTPVELLQARDKYGYTPLCTAAANIQYGMVRLLLEHGASPFVSNPVGKVQSALDAANKSNVGTRNLEFSVVSDKRAAEMKNVKSLLSQAENLISKVVQWDCTERVRLHLPQVPPEEQAKHGISVFLDIDPENQRCLVYEFIRNMKRPEPGNPHLWEKMEEIL